MIKLIRIKFCLLCVLSILSIEINAQTQLHHANSDLPGVNKNYNLLVHVAVDSTLRNPIVSETQMEKIISELNNFFSPIRVSFSVCEFNVLEDDYSLGRVDLQPLTQSEQLEELEVRFSLRRRINIYILDYIEGAACGISTFESIVTDLAANIFVETTCDEPLSGQIAHHLGHTFGLRNTFDASTIELVDGSNCATTGDLICDTPADPFGQALTEEEEEMAENGILQAAFINSNCEFIYEVRDPNGEFYQPDVGNIMSGYPCKCGFTQDQFKLMVETILSSEIKHF